MSTPSLPSLAAASASAGAPRDPETPATIRRRVRALMAAHRPTQEQRVSTKIKSNQILRSGRERWLQGQQKQFILRMSSAQREDLGVTFRVLDLENKGFLSIPSISEVLTLLGSPVARLRASAAQMEDAAIESILERRYHRSSVTFQQFLDFLTRDGPAVRLPAEGEHPLHHVLLDARRRAELSEIERHAHLSPRDMQSVKRTIRATELILTSPRCRPQAVLANDALPVNSPGLDAALTESCRQRALAMARASAGRSDATFMDEMRVEGLSRPLRKRRLARRPIDDSVRKICEHLQADEQDLV